MAAVPVLNTPDDGRLRPKHVEWLCRNKTCTVLHQVGVSFDLYYDARKHKIWSWPWNVNWEMAQKNLGTAGPLERELHPLFCSHAQQFKNNKNQWNRAPISPLCKLYANLDRHYSETVGSITGKWFTFSLLYRHCKTRGRNCDSNIEPYFEQCVGKLHYRRGSQSVPG